MPYLFNDDKSKVIVKRDLLWTNPAPDAAFGVQYIEPLLDLSDYDYVEIVFRSKIIQALYYKIQKFIVSSSYEAQASMELLSSASLTIWYRGVSISRPGGTKYGIRFAVGQAMLQNFSSGTTTCNDDNTRMIPYQIYGIKE